MYKEDGTATNNTDSNDGTRRSAVERAVAVD